MFNSNPKTSIRKYPTFEVDITFFSAHVSNFTLISLLKVKNFELPYLYKKLSYTNAF